jgi:hypothetical protein
MGWWNERMAVRIEGELVPVVDVALSGREGGCA